jgi:tRNA dimethylallyltransferase
MNKVIVITGPTSGGKSAHALRLAQKLEGVIINADAIQLYKGLPLLTACPSQEDKIEAEHVLYEFLEPNVQSTAASWACLADLEIQKALDQNKTPLVVGGSGFYILALIEGLSDIPNIDASVRASLLKELETKPLSDFFDELKICDPELSLKLNPNDQQRILRGIEVYRATWKPLSYWQKLPKKKFDYDFDLQVIMPERAQLYHNCNQRFLSMIEKGAIEEVQSFLEKNIGDKVPITKAQITKALGFHEIKLYLEQKLSLEAAIHLAQTKTRQFAKRQVTWARHQFKTDFEIIDPKK